MLKKRPKRSNFIEFYENTGMKRTGRHGCPPSSPVSAQRA
jgi:hypothetical protein